MADQSSSNRKSRISGFPFSPQTKGRLIESSGHIYGKDIYPAYKLLESFVGEVEPLRELVDKVRMLPADLALTTSQFREDLEQFMGPKLTKRLRATSKEPTEM